MAAHLTVPRNEPEVVERKRRSGFWRLAVVLIRIVIAGVGAGAYITQRVSTRAKLRIGVLRTGSTTRPTPSMSPPR